jgi:hypothetical protein
MLRLFSLLLVAAVFLQPLSLRADDLLTPEQLEHMEYKFSTFLSGDIHKIRNTVNGTLEEQLNRKAEKTRKINADMAVIQSREGEAGVKLRAASPVFARMQDDLASARADAVAAKKSSNAVAMIDAKNKADMLEKQITQQEDAAIANDPEVVAKQAEIKDTQAELKNLETAIAAASKARDELIDGLRQPQLIPGPPAVGGKGILGRVKPTKIVDAHSFSTDFTAFEVIGENKNAKTPDGFKSFSGHAHLMHILVTGVDTSRMHVGTETILDHVFTLTSKQGSGKATVYVAEPETRERKSQLINYLFDGLDDLRTADK